MNLLLAVPMMCNCWDLHKLLHECLGGALETHSNHTCYHAWNDMQILLTNIQAESQRSEERRVGKECRWKCVEPNNHRVNAVKRAIQSYKDRAISGLCYTNSEWPIRHWDQSTPQATATLNVL